MAMRSMVVLAAMYEGSDDCHIWAMDLWSYVTSKEERYR
jgi:hypothetical protein